MLKMVKKWGLNTMKISDKTIDVFIILLIVLVFVVHCIMWVNHKGDARNERICLDNGYTEYKNGYCVRGVNKYTIKAEDITIGRGWV